MRIAGYNLDPVIAIPGMAGAVLLVLLAAWPSATSWPEAPWFILLPHLTLLAAGVTGLCFTQTRIFFLSLFSSLGLFLLDRAAFARPDPHEANAIRLIASLILPPLAAILCRTQERGLGNTHGMARALPVLVAAGLVSLLPLIPDFRQAIESTLPPFLWTREGGLRIPGLSLLALLAALPFLWFKPQGESPRLGPLIALSVVVIFAAWNSPSSLFSPSSRRAALILFGMLGGTTLLLAVMETLWRHMNIDELTELPGRRRLKHHLRCLERNYVLAVVDIDHFKQINDTHGHPAGDQVLRYLASELRRHLHGTAYRYGGEEFVIIYEHQSYTTALNDLDDLRDAVSRKEFFLRGSDRPARKPRHPHHPVRVPSIHLTVSIGAAQPAAHFKTPQAVLEAADQALYQAKENGRNRVCHVT